MTYASVTASPSPLKGYSVLAGRIRPSLRRVCGHAYIRNNIIGGSPMAEVCSNIDRSGSTPFRGAVTGSLAGLAIGAVS